MKEHLKMTNSSYQMDQHGHFRIVVNPTLNSLNSRDWHSWGWTKVEDDKHLESLLLTPKYFGEGGCNDVPEVKDRYVSLLRLNG